ncbi:MAG: sulfotransferase domain-containing protein [Tsuneonella sp.]
MPSRAFNVLKVRAFTARNKFLVRACNRIVPYYVVNEFPKSGGTWLTQMLADALQLPFRRNELVRIEPSLVHGHYLHPALIGKAVVMWRDPRDVIVSFYHHCYFRDEFADRIFGNGDLVALMKQRRPFGDYRAVRDNLPQFIEFISTTPVAPRFTWPQFARNWAGRRGTVQTSYERLRAGTGGELVRIVSALGARPIGLARAEAIAEDHSFANAKARAERGLPAGAEKSFVREGSVGGWQAHFSPEALGMLSRFGYAEPMRELGYQL